MAKEVRVWEQLYLEDSPSEGEKNVTPLCQLESARDEGPLCKKLPVSRVATWREHVGKSGARWSHKQAGMVGKGTYTNSLYPTPTLNEILQRRGGNGEGIC